MSIIWIDSFHQHGDGQSFEERYVHMSNYGNGSVTWGGAGAYGGRRILMRHNTTTFERIKVNVPLQGAITEFGMGLQFRPLVTALHANADQNFLGAARYGNTEQDVFRIAHASQGGGFYLTVSDVKVQSTTTTFAHENYHLVEVSAFIDSTSGFVTLYVSGEEQFTYEGDTTAGSATAVNFCYFQSRMSANFDTYGGFYVFDRSLGVNDSCIGSSMRMFYQVPVSEISNVGFDITGGGSASDAIDDVNTNDSDATKISSVSSPARVTCLMSNLTGSVISAAMIPLAVMFTALTKGITGSPVSNFDNVSYRGFIQTSGVDNYGDVITFKGSDVASYIYSYYPIFQTQPDTGSAWRQSGINILRAGIDHVGPVGSTGGSAVTAEFRITAMGVEVIFGNTIAADVAQDQGGGINSVAGTPGGGPLPLGKATVNNFTL